MPDHMDNGDLSLKEFELIQPEGENRFFRMLDLHMSSWKGALILFCVTWMPLVILTYMEGSLLSGPGLPFIKDISVQGRLLIGVPLMVLIRKTVYKDIPLVLQYLSGVLIYPDHRQQFLNGPLKDAKRGSNSKLVLAIFILLVIGMSLIAKKGTGIIGVQSETDSWFYSVENGSEGMTRAGIWANFVSMPVFQLLLLIWLWRYLVWTRLLYRISKIDLNLQPTHPDGAGGLGVFVIAQRNFILFFITCGAVISCTMIGYLAHGIATFELLGVEIIGFVAIGVVILFCPLLFFTVKLFRVKYRGQLELSMAGSSLSKKFEGNWVAPLGRNGEVTEDFVDPSMQYDYTGIYQQLQAMRIIPVKLRDLVIAAVLLFIPFIPIFFIQFSIMELIRKLLGLLL